MTLYTLSDVQHRYGERTVLHVDSLQIAAGEIFALVGPSGTGKSTLLRLLALLEAPTHGQLQLHLQGRTITQANATIADRRQLAMLFQRPFLLARSVRANVALGLQLRGQRDIDTQVEQALARVALTHLLDAHAATLSGGEMQRVALARALIVQPSVLLLDEPTANLDPYNVQLIENLIREQHTAADTTIILVTHNVFQAQRLATRVALLLDGQLVEVAPAEQFFNTPHDPRTAEFISGRFIY